MNPKLLDYIEDYGAGLWSFDSPEEGSPPNPLVEKLVTDTHSAALMTAAVTSAVNTFDAPQRSAVTGDLHNYVPDPTNIKLGLDILSRDAPLSMRAREAIGEFFVYLEPCLTDMDRFFNDAQTLGNDRAMALHRYSLARRWRLVCQSAANAVQALAEETEDRLPDLYNLSAGILHRLLEAAAVGQSPCITADGKPYLPPLPQRRRGARRSLQMPATLQHAGLTDKIFVRDVSQGGLGLEQVQRVSEGDAVTIVLETGRSFTGVIVWRKGSRAGIRLASPLSPNDPMLWG